MKAERRRMLLRFRAISRQMLAGAVLVSASSWAADPETPPITSAPSKPAPAEPQVGPAGGTIGRALSDTLSGSAAMRSSGAIANIERPPAAEADAKAAEPVKPAEPSRRSDPK